jgi:parallel beta-helix repeat protein
LPPEFGSVVRRDPARQLIRRKVQGGTDMNRKRITSLKPSTSVKQFMGRVLALAFLGLMVTGVDAAATTHWVNDDGVLSVPPGMNCNNPGYLTIQAAVGAAAPGDRINVCAGTYMEQVTIPAGKDNLELRSVGHWQAVINAPALMGDPKAIVRVSGSQNVTILAFTITGPGGTACDSLRYGVRVDGGGSANILGNHITDIRDLPPPPTVSGCQNGVAVLVGRTAEGTTGSARIIGNVIERYQKNGPTVDNAGSHAEIAHNRILGVGPTATIAQNGVQASRGATADIQHNFISGHIYTPMAVASTGMILFQSGDVLTEHNTLTANDVGIYAIDTSGSTAAHNDVRASTFDGIALDSETASVAAHNKVRENSGPGIGLYDSQTNTLHNNEVKDNADSGILLDNADTNTVTNNQVMNNGTVNGDTTDGIRVNVTSEGNTIQKNQLRNNVTHDCHDDSVGSGTAGTANSWLDNHGGTENRPGLCRPEPGPASFETSTYGWDANYPWYAAFGEAAQYDWATAYAAIDTESLLQLAPKIGLRRIRPVTSSPAP